MNNFREIEGSSDHEKKIEEDKQERIKNVSVTFGQ